jgi:hypothetical protein
MARPAYEIPNNCNASGRFAPVIPGLSMTGHGRRLTTGTETIRSAAEFTLSTRFCRSSPSAVGQAFQNIGIDECAQAPCCPDWSLTRLSDLASK